MLISTAGGAQEAEMSITTSEPSSIPATRAGGFDTERALAAIERVLDDEPRPVALHEPQFAGSEWEYVKETLDTGWVSSAGKYVERFERQLADYCQVPHAVAVVNGTAALQVCLMLAGVHRDDEVLVPALTFIATANAVSYCGAVPHFCDCSSATLGIDPHALEQYLSAIGEVSQGQCRNRTALETRVREFLQHTQVVAHTLSASSEFELIGVLDRERRESTALEFTIVGTQAQILATSSDRPMDALPVPATDEMMLSCGAAARMSSWTPT